MWLLGIQKQQDEVMEHDGNRGGQTERSGDVVKDKEREEDNKMKERDVKTKTKTSDGNFGTKRNNRRRYRPRTAPYLQVHCPRAVQVINLTSSRGWGMPLAGLGLPNPWMQMPYMQHSGLVPPTSLGSQSSGMMVRASAPVTVPQAPPPPPIRAPPSSSGFPRRAESQLSRSTVQRCLSTLAAVTDKVEEQKKKQ